MCHTVTLSQCVFGLAIFPGHGNPSCPCAPPPLSSWHQHWHVTGQRRRAPRALWRASLAAMRFLFRLEGRLIGRSLCASRGLLLAVPPPTPGRRRLHRSAPGGEPQPVGVDRDGTPRNIACTLLAGSSVVPFGQVGGVAAVGADHPRSGFPSLAPPPARACWPVEAQVVRPSAVIAPTSVPEVAVSHGRSLRSGAIAAAS